LWSWPFYEFRAAELEKSRKSNTRRNVITIIDVLELVSDRSYYRTVLDIVQRETKIKNANYNTHKLLSELTTQIITTNYDLIFENISQGDSKILTYDNDFDLASLSETKSFIFKIHGDIKKPESCLIFKHDYEKVYGVNELSNYIIEIAKIFTNKTILFIGFSLNDPYISTMFDRFNHAYKGLQNKHFIITTEPSKYEKYKDYLLPITIKSYSELDNIIMELIASKSPKIESVQHLNEEKVLSEADIQISIPRPINKQNDFNLEVIVSSFVNFNIKLIDTFFNVEKLASTETVDYMFIFTQLIKGQLVIEDESLKYKLIKLSELNQLVDSGLKGVFLFIESADDKTLTEKDFEYVQVPVVIIPISSKKIKPTLSDVIYKGFTKADKDMLGKTYTILNPGKLTLCSIKKGNFCRQRLNTYISRFIDKKNLVKFVGRNSDQENIIRIILSMRYENKLLSIKGSGGIGKTSIVSKIGIELAERGYFEKGIFFITCNPIQSYENFEFEISQCYNLTSSKFLREQIIENVYFKDRIIILDNFETLLYLDDVEKILDLVSFICDHSIIVVTTRQILDLEYEEIYELRNLTSDEAVELFKSLYSSSISENNEKTLRRDIIERLLNNNPLAIKLIVKGLPASKDLNSLREELEKNIFLKEDIDEIFESKEDYNIERSTSLYHSINYSYINLTDSEKLAFELLSLFPDGMHMENFKSFHKASKTKDHIGDREIKQLDNKSLLENSNGFLKLQSIISRFSDYKFKMRSEIIRNDYHKIAYDFNKFFIDILSSHTNLQSSISLKILDLNTNNYLKCLDYIRTVEIETDEKLEFISKVSNIFRDTNQPTEFLDFIRKNDFEFDKEYENVLALIIQNVVYWTKDFDKPFKYIKDNYSFDKLLKLSENNISDKITADRVLSIYCTEGYDLNVLKLYIKNKMHRHNASANLFKLGYLKESYLLVPKKAHDKSYFDFEIEFANGCLNFIEVDNYMKGLYKKESLEMTQMTYLKTKLTEVSDGEVKKLVISNPYTKGLIHLMNAKNEADLSEKLSLFQKAKENLIHVKFHYIECLIELLRVLKENRMDKEYSTTWNEAFSLSKKFYFRHHLYRLELMNEVYTKEFDLNFFACPIAYSDITSYINDHIQRNKDYFKTKPLKMKKNISVLSEDFG
jgi:hypothetical protein